MTRKIIISLITCSFLVLLTGLGLSQTTLYVDGSNTAGPWHGTQADPFQHIQDGIDAAVNGDSVLVMPYSYGENIDFKGKAINVASKQGPDVTVIDGGKPVDPDFASVVNFQSGEGLDSVLEGFTLTNGLGTYDSNFNCSLGGGVRCHGASPTIRNNIISGNDIKVGGKGAGAGMLIQYNSSPFVIDNLIHNNVSFGTGAGIHIWYDSSPVIIHNKIFDNTSNKSGSGIGVNYNCNPTISNSKIYRNTSLDWNFAGIVIGNECQGTISGNEIYENHAYGSGGGIGVAENSTPLIENNLIRDNVAGSALYVHGGGGGIWCHKCEPVIRNNTIVGNKGDYGGGIYIQDQSDPKIMGNILLSNNAEFGGGIYCENQCDMILVNNTLCGNMATDKGGGLRCHEFSSAIIVNSIFWNNTAANGSQISISGPSTPSTVTLSYSDVEGGQAAVHVSTGSTLNWGAGMINADPLFVDEAGGDLHVFCTSPCCGTGDNTVPELPAEDFEGDPRVTGGTVDMGADEFCTHLYWTGNATPGGTTALKFVGPPGTTQVALIIGFNVFDPPLSGAYGEWYIAPPMILIPGGLGPIPAEGVFVLPGTLPPSVPGPYTIYFQAMIGYQLTNLSVMEVE